MAAELQRMPVPTTQITKRLIQSVENWTSLKRWSIKGYHHYLAIALRQPIAVGAFCYPPTPTNRALCFALEYSYVLCRENAVGGRWRVVKKNKFLCVWSLLSTRGYVS